MPCFKRKGKVTKSTSEGRISQKTLVASVATLVVSFVSIYSQNIARTEIKGMEASTAPNKVLRLATSDMATISVAVMTIFAR